MEKILCDVNDGGDSRGSLNGEAQTPWLSFILNAALLILELLLSAGWNISSRKWLCDLLLNEDSNISAMIFYWQPLVEHVLDEKRTVMQNNFTFHETNIFSVNVWL